MNFSKNTKKTLVTLVAAGTLIAPVAYSVAGHGQDIGSMKMHYGEKKFKKIAKRLSLSDEQIEQMKTIREESKTQGMALKEQLKSFREQVKTEQASETFDEAKFAASYAQHQETFAQLAMLKAKTRHAMAQVLSQEQLEKWQGLMEKRKGKRGGRYND
ncbi:Spy/CpxP family protein refolding chaperone [Thalassotalea sp. M1531]|uniref:Spy/CpxP family protein refolding chaperone n=1 Tax=Thalassotalea algicola TaxID=2716224 RepID=A0A7Y0LCF3_9GAMM|nr:Spy/CpxP family protein refolding chaperone [Thalassotalea algicola]NMP30520.1 Spy/CpxP family protein refolding chaperone [Thalassotalea algicola]